MKVNYYFRNPSPNNYSIESVFAIVIKELDAAIEIERYQTKKPIDLNSIFIKRRKADIHHITGAVNYLTFGLPGKKTILTVHDIGHYAETIKGWKKIVYKYLFWVFPLRRVKKITVISEFTKKQLMHHFNIDDSKIVVIPNPVNPSFRFTARRNNLIPVILQIGAGKNKNIETLIEAVKGLKVKLLLIRPKDEMLIWQMNNLDIQYEFRSDLTEDELIEAYAASDIVYFASTYEGFGLPILEGMAIGRPVVTSNVSPMRDIALDNSVLVDPFSINEVREGLQLLLNQPDEYAAYQERGLKHVELYKADKIANLYYELYKQVILE